MKFTLYHSDSRETPANCTYMHKVEVTDKDTLLRAVAHDYVCAEYKDGYRSNDNFLGSDCLPVDCDNDHSEDPEACVYPSDVANAFPGVAFAVHYSRNHMKMKAGKAARPKFHVFFAIARVTDAGQYSELKKLVNTIFPYFDTKALDAARFFFGTQKPQVEIFDGPMTLSTFLADDDFDADLDSGSYGDIVIPEGSRNATLSHYAGRILKRFGNTEEAHAHFEEVAARCQPPLEHTELDTIWRSAQRFYEKISSQDGYIPPEQYNQDLQLKPIDYSDVGQATVLSREYEDRLRYSPSTDFLVYNGRFWEESKPKAQAIAQELTSRQLDEADTEIKKATHELMKNGAWDLLASMGPKKAAAVFNPEQTRSFQKYENATTYRNFAIKRRDSKYITAAMKEVHPMVEIDQKALDADEYLLNTPSATYDLRVGLSSAQDHNAADLITKQTTVTETGADGSTTSTMTIDKAAHIVDGHTFYLDKDGNLKVIQTGSTPLSSLRIRILSSLVPVSGLRRQPPQPQRLQQEFLHALLVHHRAVRRRIPPFRPADRLPAPTAAAADHLHTSFLHHIFMRFKVDKKRRSGYNKCI